MAQAGVYPNQYRNTALSNTPQQVGVAGGLDVLSWRFINPDATNYAYVKLYNKATTPTVGTDVPMAVIPVLPGPGVSEMELMAATLNAYIAREHFEAGCWVAATHNLADTDNTAPTTVLSVAIKYVP